MAANVEIVPFKAKHLRTVARRMRQADIDEVAAASGRSPADALVYSARHSRDVWTVLMDGKPEVIFGVGDINILAGIGAPWLLGTDAVDRNFVPFLRLSEQWRSQLLARYPVMRNFVDERNKTSLRWLRWLGFTLSEPMILRGHPFRLFELRQEHV